MKRLNRWLKKKKNRREILGLENVVIDREERLDSLRPHF